MKLKLLGIGVVLLIAAFMIGSAFAAPGGQGKGKGRGKHQTQTVVAEASIGCLGDTSSATPIHGTVSTIDTHTFDVCNVDSTLRLLVSVSWYDYNPTTNLDLLVTAPDGTTYLRNRTAGTIEVMGQRAPVQEGTWTIEVINQGSGNVDYGVSIVFA